jgi:AraC family transcriptional regulator
MMDGMKHGRGRQSVPAVPLLGPGVFYGQERRELQTSSFEYAEMSIVHREVPRHTHARAHFVLVVQGVYLTAALPDEGACGPGTLVFNPSGTTHRDRFRGRHGRFFAISVAPEIASHIERTIHVPVAFASEAVSRTIQAAYAEFHGKGDVCPMIMEGLGLELAGRAGQWPDLPDRRVPAWLVTARDAIRDSRDVRLRVSDVADQSGVHPIHLARGFRQFFHCSPGEYARRCRMERVVQLLTSEKAPLAEIALQSGFKDQSHLTHAFKRFMGVTPSAFRRSFRR